MNHTIIARRPGHYLSFPSLAFVGDKLYCAYRSAPTKQSKTHIDTRSIAQLLCSGDWGETWSRITEIEGPGSFAGLQDPVLSNISGELITTFFVWKSLIGKHTKKRRQTKAQGVFLDHFIQRKGQVNHRILGGQALQFFGRGPIESIGPKNLLPVYADVGGGGTCCFVLAHDEGAAISKWTVRSRIAHDPQLDFTEPVLMGCGDDHVLCILRGSDGQLYQSHSWDRGQTWEPHRATGMFGAPASLCHLGKAGKHRVLCTYGYRRKPYGIRACLSYDDGLTWDTKNEIVIRADGGGWDLGYPSTVRLEAELFTAYYFYTKRDKTRRIELTRWRI